MEVLTMVESYKVEPWFCVFLFVSLLKWGVLCSLGYMA